MKRQRQGRGWAGAGDSTCGNGISFPGRKLESPKALGESELSWYRSGNTAPAPAQAHGGEAPGPWSSSALSRHREIGFPFANLLGTSQSWSCSFPPGAPALSCQHAVSSPPKSCRDSVWMMQQGLSRASRAEASCKNYQFWAGEQANLNFWVLSPASRDLLQCVPFV